MSIFKRLFGSAPPKNEESEVEEEELVEPNPLEDAVLNHVGDEVASAVSRVQSERGVSFEESARGLYRAAEEGRILLVDPRPPTSFLGYLASGYSAWFWAVVGFLGVMVASIYVIPQVYPFSYVRIVAGGVFTLYVPGFALIEALYPMKDDLERLERLGLSLGLSLALVPLIGLVLNYTPWGIRLDPILVSLMLFTLALGVGGVYRKYGFYKLSGKVLS